MIFKSDRTVLSVLEKQYNEHSDHFYRFLKVIFWTAIGSLAMFFQTATPVRDELFGEDWEREWLWWISFVPLYVFVIIYALRFSGRILLRLWIEDLVSSKFAHRSIAALMSGILADPQLRDDLADLLKQDSMVNATTKLTVAVLESPEVQNATVQAISNGLHSAQLLEAATGMVSDTVSSPQLGSSVAILLSRVLSEERTVTSSTEFMSSVMAHPSFSQLLKDRCKSFLHDPEMYEAGYVGLGSSVLRSLPHFTGPSLFSAARGSTEHNASPRTDAEHRVSTHASRQEYVTL